MLGYKQKRLNNGLVCKLYSTKEVMKVATNILKVEETMASAIPQALKRKPEERGSFDKLTIDELKKSLSNWIADAEYRVSTIDERESQAENNVQQSLDHKDKAEEDEESANSLLDTVQTSIKDNKKETRNVVDQIKEHPGKVKETCFEKDEAERKRAEFEEAFAAFDWLKNRTEIVVESDDIDMEGQEDGLLMDGQHSGIRKKV